MSQVTTREFDWTNEVKRAEGESFFEKPVVYEFSTGRTFKEQDPHGPYAWTPEQLEAFE